VSIQDLGAIGELISSVAVVVSLIYLAVQVRENTRTQRITAAQDVIRLSAANNTVLTTNPQLFYVMSKWGQPEPELTAEELAQYRTLMLSIFAAHWQVHFLHAQGVLDDEIFLAYERRTQGMLASPLAREWWQGTKHRFSESYQRYVDGLT
jgi:hypothetical protein